MGLPMAGVFLSPHDVDIDGEDFIDFRPAMQSMRYSIAVQSCNSFLNWFKLVGFFARIPSFGLLMDTFANSAMPLVSFTLVFFIVFWGFSQAHTMLFGKTVSSYRSIELSMWTLLRAMLGDFNFDEMFSANRFLGPVFFFTYIVVGVLIILNVVIAIIADAYIEAQEMMEEKKKKQVDDDNLVKEIILLVHKKMLQIPFIGPCLQRTFEGVQTRTRKLSKTKQEEHGTSDSSEEQMMDGTHGAKQETAWAVTEEPDPTSTGNSNASEDLLD